MRDLVHRYTRDGDLTVLDGVTFDVEQAGYITLTGPSGAGKTTLRSIEPE